MGRGRGRRFVENGGTLVLSALTGTRDENNHIIRELAPGPGLAEMNGVRVIEFGRTAPLGGDGLFQRGAPPHGMYGPPMPLPAEFCKAALPPQSGRHRIRGGPSPDEVLEARPVCRGLGAGGLIDSSRAPRP